MIQSGKDRRAEVSYLTIRDSSIQLVIDVPQRGHRDFHRKECARMTAISQPNTKCYVSASRDCM